MWTSGTAACTLKLDLEMREIADCMAEFTECIQHDIANALQLLPGAVVVKRVRAGSVYVDLEITAPGAAGREHELIGSLQRQASNPSSCLLSGIYTCKVLTIRAAARDKDSRAHARTRARTHTHTHTRTHTHTGLDHKCGYARRGRRAEWRCTNHQLTRCRRGQ